MAVAGPVAVDRQIALPLKDAVRISVRNITIRLVRAMITGAGTMLGIAFLMSVFTSALLQTAAGTIMDQAQTTKNTWLVVMSLLVSVVGITNSMLMSVTERYKEIGTMKCLGALDQFIVKLFLLESGMLGFFGSLIGALLGAVFMLLTKISLWGRLNWGLFFFYIGVCVLIGTVLSIVAALPPAMRAAKMPPAVAMRSEI